MINKLTMTTKPQILIACHHALPFYVTLLLFVLFYGAQVCDGQDYDEIAAAPPPEQDDCNGIFLSYTFVSRLKEYPHLKNASAQAWAFKAQAMVLNAGDEELNAWKMFIGFQHKEILVSASGAVLVDASDFPAAVGNGTYLVGSPTADLKTSIETAGDIDQISVKMEIIGTQFGVKPPGVPMPRTIRLENDGHKCPAPRVRGKFCLFQGSCIYICCMHAEGQGIKNYIDKLFIQTKIQKNK
jgi:hypothetical protein